MNEWKESKWFKDWLAIARQGQNATKRGEGFADSSVLADRQGMIAAETTETEAAPQWQMAE